MKQIKQGFRKKIRQQKIDHIFKINRQKYFNYTYQTKQSKQQFQNNKHQCISEFDRYIQQIDDSLHQQNFSNLCNSIKQSFHFMKKIINKYKSNQSCIKFIVQNWFNSNFDQRFFNIVEMFEKIGHQNFSSIRKETYKYIVSHFCEIYQYENLIQQDKKENSHQLFNFLFLALCELSRQISSIQQVLIIINSMLRFPIKVIHDFFILNQRHNKQINNNSNKLISFQQICYLMFQNKDQLSNFNSHQQQNKLNEIKMSFIQIFSKFGYQIDYMNKHIKQCKQAQINNKPHSQKLQQTYRSTLEAFNWPKQELKLINIFDKPVISIILQIITQMRTYHLNNWPQSAIYQQNLTYSVQAFRKFIELHNRSKIMIDFENQFSALLDLLIVREVNSQLKREIMYLIDAIIFLDDSNQLTNYFVNSYNLFQKVWGLNDESIMNVKINIINNLLLCTSGFHEVVKHLSQICIQLHETKLVSLGLSFCGNYFIHTEYSLIPSSRGQLVIQLLYSFPKQKYTIDDIKHEIYIFQHLYDNSYSGQLPRRYQQWRKQYEIIYLNDRLEVKQLNQHQQEQKMSYVQHMIDMADQIRNKENKLYNYMEYQ